MTNKNKPKVVELTPAVTRSAAPKPRPNMGKAMRRSRRPIPLRYDLHPRLEVIAAALDAGELAEGEAYDQMIAAAAESPVLKAMPEPERMATLDGMRQAFRDPDVLAALRGERKE